MLAAAIWFIRCALGITQIYYHSYDSGRMLKRIRSHPPRSLYTTLPRKFRFNLVTGGSRFLERHIEKRLSKNNQAKLSWYHLDL